MSEQPSFVYVADPMCSWCWGFAPVIEAVAERYELPVQLVMGGLRGGSEARMMTDRLADELGHHWEQVDRASGQPFDLHVLDRRDWRYDTEVTCRAVVVVRELAPELARPALHHLQRAFYVEGTPVVDDETAVDVVSAFLTEHGREDLVRPFATQGCPSRGRTARCWSARRGHRSGRARRAEWARGCPTRGFSAKLPEVAAARRGRRTPPPRPGRARPAG